MSVDFAADVPNDIAAERAVIGAALTSTDAITDTINLLRPADFYRAAHQTMWTVITGMYGNGVAVDAITVADALAAAGEMQHVGGRAYLADLVGEVVVATNAGYWARIVADLATRRRVMEVGSRISQIAGSDTDSDDLADRVTALVHDAVDTGTGDTYVSLGDMIEPTLSAIETIAAGSAGDGIATGFPELDDLLTGLHPGQMIIIAARPAIGKALALDTALRTPTGWTTMGEVAVGDLILGADGTPTQVVAVTDAMHGRPCYAVEFMDGTVIVADASHQWVTAEWQSRIKPNRRVRTTRELASLVGERAMDVTGADDEHRIGIADVRKVPSVPVRCVQVDADDHLYLAGRSLVPTHNSTLAMDVARQASIRGGHLGVFFSLEMSRIELTMRVVSAEARVGLHHLRSGNVSEEDWGKIAARMADVAPARLFIDDSPSIGVAHMRATCRKITRQHGPIGYVIVDYLQLMSSGRRVESRQQEVSEMSRNLKLLAKELGVPIIALSQLNRSAEQRSDKMPMLSDLRESGSLEQDSDVVILLHREDAYDKESTRAGEADLIVAKNRNGVASTVTVAFQGHYARFVPMAAP